jgi:para-aminobenzoate synthetase component 1
VDRKAPAETRQCAILSSSPELFLDLVGREVISRPIKGTRARSVDPQADERLRLELAASPKDRAELAMIVDLTRNDLGRVCDYGSIEVVDDGPPAGPFALERHPTVHHLVATVTGRLADGRDAIDLLRACFPCGSITGAPKVRAMEIIDELEPTERSVYTGAIGCFAPGGRMTMNVAIRTIIQAGGRLHWYAGGGIVADSDPLAEYDEAVAKALGMRKAVEQMCGMPPAAGGHAVAQPAATASTQAMLSPPAAHDLAGVPTAPAETEMLP